MQAYLNAIAYHLPEPILTNEQLNDEFPEWSADKISSKTGIFERHIAGIEECASDLGIKAALKLFAQNSINPQDIDFVLYCTQSPDYFLPTTSCIIQNKLGIPTSAGALDYNLGCSGFVYGLALAKGLIVAGIAKNILLITADTYSKFINFKDKSNRTIFGDGASASLVTADRVGAEIGTFSLGTDGSGAENLIVRNGGLRNRKSGALDVVTEDGFQSNDDNLYMNGGEIFKFTSQAVPKLVEDTCDKNNLTLENMDLFVFHQANRFMLDHIRKKIAIPPEKFYICLEKFGNTVSSTIPIALSNALLTNNIRKDSKVLLAGFGVGYSWGGTILKY